VKTRAFLLITVLAVMFGATSAIAQETDDDTPPADNTGFVATISDESLDDAVATEAETRYIRYHVCSLNPDAVDTCDETLDDEDFDPDGFEEWSEIAVEANGAGEFNHGSFVSAFAREFDGGPGKGCVLRFIAQSNWGKDGVDGEDVLINAKTSCAFNRTTTDDGPGGKPAWAGNGKPPWAGPDGDKSTKPGQGPRG
jgi:hypothetical protein